MRLVPRGLALAWSLTLLGLGVLLLVLGAMDRLDRPIIILGSTAGLLLLYLLLTSTWTTPTPRVP